MAVLISITSLVITFIEKNSETKRTIRSQLTDVISNLDSAFDEINKLEVDNSSNLTELYKHNHRSFLNRQIGFLLKVDNSGDLTELYKRNRRSFLNGRIRFLARQAIFLMDQMPKLVTDFEYTEVADAFQRIGEFDQANTYYEKEIDKSDRTYYKSIIMRAYAGCLFNQHNFQDGRKYYQESIKLVPPDSNVHIYHIGETYDRWARMEAEHLCNEEAKELINKAKSMYEKIDDIRLKNKALINLNTIAKLGSMSIAV